MFIALLMLVLTGASAVHDAVGNLVFDAVYWYQYDGLVQVNEAGTLTEADFDADTGFLIPPDPNDPDGVPGDPVARFAYDGLGRLIFYSTHLDYSEPIDEHVNRHLYYDGVRRVSEQRHTRLWGYPIVDRWDQLDYVWGPDYVDELALVIHREGGVRYAIQDANYNLVAWLKAGSVVAAQYTYGPYGELRAADLRPTETEWPSMGVGHQGLFFIRFDGDPDDPPHAVGARGLYYNRNRWYSPDLGRFIQRDVNETALPIIVALAFNGETLDALLGAFDGQGLYGDGMNLYAYLGANPVNGLDALGLDEYDDLFDDLSGHRLYALGAISEGARYASLGIETALDIAGTFLGIDVLASVAVLASGSGGFWDAMNIVAAANPVGRLGRVGGILGKAFKWGRRGSKSSHIVGTAAEHLFKILPYKQAKKLTSGFKGKIQAHHILEVRHATNWSVKTGDIPAVILSKAQHNQITMALRQKLPYGTSYKGLEGKARVWRAYQEVYTNYGYGDWLQHIERYFR